MAEVSQIAFTKSLSDSYAPAVIVMYQFLFGAVFFLPLLLTRGIAHFDASLKKKDARLQEPYSQIQKYYYVMNQPPP